MTVGRFQPFTQGHLNMVNEGDGPCIVYQIVPPPMPKSINELKVKGKKVKKEQIQKVLKYLNHEDVSLTEDEKEILKRPFTNELVAKELDIVKKTNPNIVDIVYVKNMYDALDQFNAFCTDQGDEYEPQYWMCGDDRVDTYSKEIGRYDELETSLGSGEKIPNILKGRLQTNTGKGRTEGVSGTAVRSSIVNNDKETFTKIMPKGVNKMFDQFVDAFNEYKGILEGIIKEWKTSSLKDYILENLK